MTILFCLISWALIATVGEAREEMEEVALLSHSITGSRSMEVVAWNESGGRGNHPDVAYEDLPGRLAAAAKMATNPTDDVSSQSLHLITQDLQGNISDTDVVLIKTEAPNTTGDVSAKGLHLLEEVLHEASSDIDAVREPLKSSQVIIKAEAISETDVVREPLRTGRTLFTHDESIGLLLALAASVLSGLSFPLKKQGLELASEKGSKASLGGYGFLWEPIWWFASALMITGEGFNSAAYAFASPALVTPLGALANVLAAVFAFILLGEQLSWAGWKGSFFCMVGCLVIVMSAPTKQPMTSFGEIIGALTAPAFMIYGMCTLGLAFLLVLATTQRQEHSLPLLVSICSLVGSMTVMTVRALSLSVRLLVEGHGTLMDQFLPLLMLLLCLVVFLSAQVTYLNRALDAFNSVMVCPVYYALFTSLTLAADFVCTRQWEHYHLRHSLLVILGLATITAGVAQMQDAFSERK